MMAYVAPITEQLAVLRHISAIDAAMDARGESPELAEMVLDEAAKFAAKVYAPLNPGGDREGAKLDGGRVKLPSGFAEAYRAHAESGWTGIAAPKSHGGQGLPLALAAAVQEQMMAANLALSLGPILSAAAVEVFRQHGTAEQCDSYLEPLVSGRWPATMCMTEPQAGSDVGALACRAVPQNDGSYGIAGSKIFITWGDHDAAEVILHLVLARLPNAPEGSRGVSLFLVPSRRIEADGSVGSPNDVQCVSIEHKLGIRGSPTCTLVFGEQGSCQGWLIGQENRGLVAMFAMMNPMRVSVAIQGVAVAERALQAATSFAFERLQSKLPSGTGPVPIIHHPDVQRMIARMRALTEASRALAYYTATSIDLGIAGDADAVGLADCLKPLAKLFCTEAGVTVANEAVQVFGGMGFVEETGVAQFLRDARIAPIYEGTNGIQALDFVQRKLALPAIDRWLEEMVSLGARSWPPHLRHPLGVYRDIVAALAAAVQDMRACNDERHKLHRAYSFASFFAATGAGALMLKQLAGMSELAGDRVSKKEVQRKAITTAFYLTEILPAERARLTAIGEPPVLGLEGIVEDYFQTG
jgi:alkylation response protein AidB-like acyl-CoA dehydrogenase